jgi:uncharacterized protein
MRKYLLILFFICTLLFAQPEIPQLQNYANDFTGTLTSDQVERINSELLRFDYETTTQIVFLMINTLDDYPIEMYANEVAEKNGIGTKENDNGILFLVALNDRKMRIEVGYGLEGALPDALAGSIIRNEIAPQFKQGNYYAGVAAGVIAIEQATKGEYTREDKDRKRRADDDDGGFPFIYIIFLILMLLFGGRGRGGLGTLLLFGALSGGRSRGGFSGGGGFGGGGFGGFSGGGGSFGGGGASGGW